MRNNKGFTLIELIATITILAIIMMIAVPNVVSIVTKNKNQTYVNDARKMVSLAKYKFESDASIIKPSDNNCVIFNLNYLDKTELLKGPEGGFYTDNESYVVIKYDSSSREYVYSVQLVESYQLNGNSLRKGISLTNYADLVKTDAKNKYIKSGDFSVANDNTNVVANCDSTGTVVYPIED